MSAAQFAVLAQAYLLQASRTLARLLSFLLSPVRLQLASPQLTVREQLPN
jgi:hypothetical protein